MNKTYYIIGLFFILLYSSCNNSHKNVNSPKQTFDGKEDSLWFAFPKKRESNNDSIKILMRYSLITDTIDLQPKDKRFTYFFYSIDEKISKNEIETLIDSRNFEKLKNLGFNAYNITGKDSLTFFLKKFDKPSEHQLIGLIYDNILLFDYSENNDARGIEHTIFTNQIIIGQK